VTDDWGASYRYRCAHGAEQLRADGVPANVMHIGDPNLLAALPAYSVVVLFRLPWSGRVEALLLAIRRQGATPVFEIDDLIFDPEFEPLLGFLRDLRPSAQREYRERFRRLRRTFDACDAFVGSTPALVRAAVALGRREAILHPNLVPSAYEQLARWLVRRGRMSPPTIAYLSGSNTHDRDFAVASGALARILTDDRRVRLLVCGFVDLPAAMRPFADRVVQIPYQDWRVYPWAVAGCAVTLAPMAVRNAFADAKSALKFFEPGIFGVPVVATPTEPFRAAIVDGETGFLADTEDEWEGRIRQALDPDVGRAVGRRARAAVQAAHTQSANQGRLVALLGPLVGRAIAAPPPALSLEPGVGGPPPLARGEHVRRAWSLVRGRAPEERVVRAAAPWGQPVAAEPFTALLREVDATTAERISTSVPVLRDLVRDAAEWDAWHPSPALDVLGAGHYRARDADPALQSPALDIDGDAYRWLLVHMAVTADVPAPRAQLFWTYGGGFHEAASVTWEVDADGAMHTWVLDLHETGWGRSGRITGVRLDPLDRPGTITLERLTLLGDLAQLDGDVAATTLAMRHLRGRGVCVRIDTPPLSPAAHAIGVDAEDDVAAASCDFVVAATPIARPVRPGGALLIVGDAAAQAEVAGFDVVERAPGATLLRRPAGDRDGEPRVARPVDIVVPIFNARADVVACLESVLRHARGDWRLVPVDDASTDAMLAVWLDDLARREPRVRLLRNDENQGFVGTANHGMREADGRDVLLLNSDTVVSEGFLAGLQGAAYAGDGPAIASPLSNNATILSVPEFCADNPLPRGYSLDEFAALVAGTSLRRRTVLPTAHGFCMYVPAIVMETIGLFDQTHFGRGFGEENDLCERSRAAGFPSVVADDVYVWHSGGASFGEAAALLTREHAETLRMLHPEYLPRVARFVEENPLAPVQANLQLALHRRATDVPALLCMLHSSFDVPGGGTEHHVRDLVQGARLPRVVVAAPAPDGIHLTEVFDGRLDEAVRYRIPLAEPPVRFMLERPEMEEAVRTIVDLFGIGAVHLHQLCNWPVRVWRTLAELGVPYVATFQDFYPVSPNVNLFDVASNRLCCLEADGDCTACLANAFRTFGLEPPADPAAYLARHRAEFRGLFDGAERVFFPAMRTRDIVTRFQPIEPPRAMVIPHGYLEPSRRARPQPRRRPLNVALLGEVAYPIKGSRNHLPLMERTRDLPIAWHVFGEAERFGYADALRAIGLRSRLLLHGWYQRDAIFERLAAAEIDLVVFLPPWPETFSYTLSEALVAGVPVIVSDQGALPERVRADGVGVVVGNVDEAVAAVERLLAHPEELETLAAAAQRFRHRSLAEMADAYRPIYTELLGRAPAPTPLGLEARRQLAALHGAATPRAVTPPEATVPALPHYHRRWYQYYRHIAHLVPEPLRRWGREQVVARWWRTVRALRFGASQAKPDGLELVHTGGGRVTYRALHADPSFVLEVAPFRSSDVRVIRFGMRYEAPGATHAQVYWAHRTGEPFTEDKSLVIPLTNGDGGWREYAVMIDQSDRRATWDDGDEIRHLRFDPINAAGTVELAEFRLCAPAER
jgi:GT2 family glycosyltransferase/glycosyltransferase involved in cell wall biosynthesis